MAYQPPNIESDEHEAMTHVGIVKQGKQQHDQSMRLIRGQCEHGERLDEEAVSTSSWKEHSELEDDCNTQE